MASLRASFPIWILMFLFFAYSQAREILVGGELNSWRVPESCNKTLNQWAQKTRFKVGDFLVWKYDEKVDSVLQVTKEDYERCNTSKPIKDYRDGDTKVRLGKSGPQYFISGANGNCGKGEKLVVVVLSPNHWPQISDGLMAPAPAAAKSGGAGLTGRGFWSASLFGLALVFALA